jgi:hypothetical protein
MQINLKKWMSVVLLGFSVSSQAGLYSDDLSRCLVESSTENDKTLLVRWMFTSMALHPDVASMSNVTEAQRDTVNKAAAEMFVRLMTETCVTQAKKAIQYEGAAAVEQGFNAFGQVAGKELFANPNVAQALAGLHKHIDTKKLETVLGL